MHVQESYLQALIRIMSMSIVQNFNYFVHQTINRPPLDFDMDNAIQHLAHDVEATGLDG